MREGGWDRLQFRLHASLSDATTCNTPTFGAWAIGNQYL